MLEQGIIEKSVSECTNSVGKEKDGTILSWH